MKAPLKIPGMVVNGTYRTYKTYGTNESYKSHKSYS
jgi:hypothetical protein